MYAEQFMMTHNIYTFFEKKNVNVYVHVYGYVYVYVCVP